MERSTLATFRMALVAYALAVAAVIVHAILIGPRELPDAAATYLSWFIQQPQSSLQQVVGWLGIVGAVTSIVGALGMLRFARWARTVFTLSVVALLCGEGLFDLPVLKTPGEYLLDSIAGILSGAIVVFSYLSKLSDEFPKGVSASDDA